MRRRWHHRRVTFVDSAQRVSVTRRWRGAAALAGLALVSALVASVVALFDHVTVANLDGLSRVAFGYPLKWLTQDQSALDPPFPARTSPASPWENPTSVEVGPLIVDVLVVYAVLVTGWFVARIVIGRFRGVAA